MDGQKQIQIKAKDEDLKGCYSNMIQIFHTKEEFCLDFFNLLPPQGILSSRVIMSPAHFKRMLGAMKENLSKYESQFGNIEPAKEMENKIGFEDRS
jgi:hypothetical protein